MTEPFIDPEPEPELSARQRAFLAAFARCGVVTTAAAAAQVSRRDHPRWMADDSYASAFADAAEEAADRLEEEARRRAIDGWPEPIMYQGAVVGTVQRYSDRLLELLLHGHRPETFRERMSMDVITEDRLSAEIQALSAEIARRRALGAVPRQSIEATSSEIDDEPESE